MNRAVATAIHIELPTGIQSAAFRMDIQHSRLAKSVFGGKRSRDQILAIDEARIELCAEAGDALRDQHVIDAILHVGVIVTDVKAARSGGILAHSREAKHEFAEGNVLSLAEILDVLLVNRVNRRAQAGHNLLPLPIELTHDCNFGQLREFRCGTDR